MGLMLGGVSAHDLVLDGHSVSLWVGGSPPEKIWPTTDVVQITLGAGNQPQVQLRAALSDRGLDYQTVTEIPFDIELVGSGSAQFMFSGCSSLTHVPDMDTSQVTSMWGMFLDCASLTTIPLMDTGQVTDMSGMFEGCMSLTSVPDLDTSQVTDMSYMFLTCPALTHVPDMDTSQVTYVSGMFYDCAALTDGNVRLVGRNPNVDTTDMIKGSGLTREPFYTADGQPWPTAEVHEVSLTDVRGTLVTHPLLTVTVPAGETWSVRIQGTVTKAPSSAFAPAFIIGGAQSEQYVQGAAVDFSGTVTAANSTIAMGTGHPSSVASFVGTVTIEK